jgi:small subunit ribosomal protein S18
MIKKKQTTKRHNNSAGNAQRNTGCYFTQTGTKPDYKDVLVLRRFINDRGKVLPQKYTNLTSKNQRALSQEVKKARFMGLLAYTDRHMI